MFLFKSWENALFETSERVNRMPGWPAPWDTPYSPWLCDWFPASWPACPPVAPAPCPLPLVPPSAVLPGFSLPPSPVGGLFSWVFSAAAPLLAPCLLPSVPPSAVLPGFSLPPSPVFGLLSWVCSAAAPLLPPATWLCPPTFCCGKPAVFANPPSWHTSSRFTPFTSKSDQIYISLTAPPEILHHTVRRTWLFIAYSDERWLYHHFSLPPLYISFSRVNLSIECEVFPVLVFCLFVFCWFVHLIRIWPFWWPSGL